MDEPIDAYYEEFLRNLLAEKNASGATLESYRSDFQKFKNFLRTNSIKPEIQELTTRDMKRYVNYLKIDCAYSTSTVRRRIHSLSSFCKYLMEMEYIEKNPMLAIHAPKAEQKLPIYIKQHELEKLLEAPRLYARFPSHVLRDQTMLALLIYTGARKSEIIALDWKDADFKNESIVIHKGKGNKERLVPLLEPLALILLDYYEQRKPGMEEPILISDNRNRISTTDFHQLFQHYLRLCGLSGKGYTPHKCRHSMASLLIQQGVDLISVSEILEHADLNSSKLYAHNSTAHLRDDMRKFPVKSK